MSKAYELPRKHLLNNQRKPLPSRSERARTKRARRAGNDAEHLDQIRQLSCLIPACGANVGIDPHHLKSGPAARERSVGRRSSDKFCVPLCRYHHDLVEREGSRGEAGFFDAYGFPDIAQVALALYAAPSVPLKQQVLKAERTTAEDLILARDRAPTTAE